MGFYLLFLCGAVQGFCSIEVELIESVAVRSTTITLGDIAHISADDSSSRQRVAQIIIDQFPNVDTSRVISSFKIKKTLEQAGFQEVKLTGLNSKVYVDTQIVPVMSIEKAIEDWLHSLLTSDVEAVIQYEKIPHQWKVPAGEQFSIEVTSAKNRIGGVVSLTLKAVDGKKMISSSQARINVALYRPVVTLARHMKKGDHLDESSLMVQRMDVTQSNGMEIADLKEVLGKVLKKDLGADSLLYRQDLDLPILIEKGSLNRIIVVNGDLKMNMTGAKALQNGKKAETINFTNPINEKTVIQAKVIRAGLAVMHIN
jgi:flagella basal body P-ring formation protein FlgA